MASTAVVAGTLLALAFLSAPPPAVRAGDGPRPGAKAQASGPDDQPDFVAQIKRTLKRQHDRMIDLASQLIESADGPEDLEAQLPAQSIKIESAKASLESAVLRRELAEIALKEYEEAISAQEKSDLETELELARGDLASAGPQIQLAQDRFAQLQKTRTGSTADVIEEMRSSAGVRSAEFKQKKAGFAIDQAEGKLKILLEYDKPKRVKELQSAVKTAKSDELANRATWDLEQSRLGRLQKAINERDLPERKARDLLDRQALASLDRAIPIEEKLRLKLEQLIKDGKSDDPLRREIQDLTTQLQALVDQAEIARSTVQFDMMKTRIHASPKRRPSFNRK